MTRLCEDFAPTLFLDILTVRLWMVQKLDSTVRNSKLHQDAYLLGESLCWVDAGLLARQHTLAQAIKIVSTWISLLLREMTGRCAYALLKCNALIIVTVSVILTQSQVRHRVNATTEALDMQRVHWPQWDLHDTAQPELLSQRNCHDKHEGHLVWHLESQSGKVT